MKKIIVICILAMCTMGCASVNHLVSKTFPSKQSYCPTNNSSFFFKQNGARPTKQYLRNHRN